MDEVSQTRDVYESEADRYIEKYHSLAIAAEYGQEFLDALEKRHTDNSEGRVLDVGCGPGRDVDVFTDAGFSVTGFDVTQSFLLDASERIGDARFVRGDMRDLPFQDGTFDGLWACASFHHVPREEAPATLREYRRVLDPDGHLQIFVKRDPEMHMDDSDRHFEYYQPTAFNSLLENAGFEILSTMSDERWVGVFATR